jgi:hypothetical protein
MPRLVLPNEETLPVVHHPETLRGAFRDGHKFSYVHHEIQRCLQRGYGEWPGDPRYALYAHPDPPPAGTWYLVRLEYDRVYRTENRWPGTEFSSNFELLAAVIRWVQEHDTRRGYDPVAEIEAHEAALERERERVFSDFTQDFADHYLYHALKKDGADDYC